MKNFFKFNQDIIQKRQEYWTIKSYPFFAHLLFIMPVLVLCFGYHFAITDFEQGKLLKTNYELFTKFIRYLSNYTNLLFYAFYLYILVRAYKLSSKSEYTAQARQDALLFFKTMFWQIIIGLCLVTILKYSLGFSRPVLLGAAAKAWAFAYAYTSMPSGHTTEIFILALPLALYYKDKKIIFSLLCLLATTVAFSRLWLQAHYLEDVLVGLCLASLASFLILKNFKVKEDSYANSR